MTPKPLLTPKQKAFVLMRLGAILDSPLPEEDKTPILDAVRLALRRREALLRAAERFGTPLYVLSEADLVDRARRFQRAFSSQGLCAEVFFAYKANELPYLCRRLHREGVGAEVVSEMELRLALRLGCRQILFNGPAKSEEEFRLTARHADRVWLHMDHAREIERFTALCLRPAVPIRTAVRIDPGPKIGGAWRKFGVSPKEAVAMIRTILRTRGLQWEGLHGHLSWNTSPGPYRELIRIFAGVLKALTPKERARLRYLDLGGGFYPSGEGVRLPDFPEGRIALLAEEDSSRRVARRRVIFPKVADISEYGGPIREEIEKSILSLPGVRPDLAIRFEPGRWLAANTVGILLSVVTQKGKGAVLADGGIHLTHDHRMQEEYHPIVNLSRPGRRLQESRRRVFGPMCDPHDWWGDTCWGEPPVSGDRLWVANMGAYGSSSAMRFLFPLAPYILLAETGTIRRLTDREPFDHRYPREWFSRA